MGTWLSRVPWMVWALLAPAVIIAVVQWQRPQGDRVMVVGAGLVHLLHAQERAPGHAPPGTFYDLDTRTHEPLAATEQRVQAVLSGWPNVIVFGIDAAELTDSAAEQQAQQVLTRLTAGAENATAVPVVLSPAPAAGDGAAIGEASARVGAWFRAELCQQPGLRLCVDLMPHASAPTAVRAAVAAAVRRAIERHAALRATTQVGR